MFAPLCGGRATADVPARRQTRATGASKVGSVKVLRGFPRRDDSPHVALTIGNFDGVHRGHQAMLTRVREAADDLGLAAAVLTFDPHPREYFARSAAPPRLSTLRGKLEAFAAFGIDRVHIARFDRTLAELDANAFVERVLVERLNVRWILVGDDFRFGRGRAGNLALLRANARSFSVEAMPTVLVDGERVSSSAVREAIASGDLERARRLLGRPYAIGGRVVHGRKLGRTLGFPTANIALRGTTALAGIYAVQVRGLGATPRAGVASVGVRPTVTSGGKRLLEVYVFDFDEAIYGRRVLVEFLHKIREEERYSDLDTLSRQIRADVEHARRYFATVS